MMKVVRHLFEDRDKSYYLTQLARELNIGFNTGKHNVSKLVGTGIVQRIPIRTDRRTVYYHIVPEIAEKLLKKYRRHVSFELYKLVPYGGIDVPSLLESEAFTAECKRYEFDPHGAVEALCKNTKKMEVKQSMWTDGPDKRFLIRKEQ